MPDTDSQDLSRLSLTTVLGPALKTSLGRWKGVISEVNAAIGSARTQIQGARISPAPPPPDQLLLSAERQLADLAVQIGRTIPTLTTAKEILEVRKSETDYKAAIVNAWPTDLVADRLSYLGAGVFAAGGAAYALSGFPHLSWMLIPPILFWAAGLGLLLYGIYRLAANQNARVAFFERQFSLEIQGE